MYGTAQEVFATRLKEIEQGGLFKRERTIETPQQAEIAVTGGERVLNFCANNYLGLADNKQVSPCRHCSLGGVGLRTCERAVYLWHTGDPQKAGGAAHRVFGHRGHHPLLVVF